MKLKSQIIKIALALIIGLISYGFLPQAGVPTALAAEPMMEQEAGDIVEQPAEPADEAPQIVNHPLPLHEEIPVVDDKESDVNPVDEVKPAPEEEPNKAPAGEVKPTPEEEPNKAPADEVKPAAEEEPNKAPVDEVKPTPEEEPNKAPVDEVKPAAEEEPNKAPVDEVKPAPKEEPSKEPADEVITVPAPKEQPASDGQVTPLPVKSENPLPGGAVNPAPVDPVRTVPVKVPDNNWKKRLPAKLVPVPANDPAKNPELPEMGKPGVEGQEVSQEIFPSLWYKVRLGESLWLIGKNLGVKWQRIMELNKLVSTIIYPDQKLGIPDVEVAEDGTIKYNIKDKDTLYWIGQSLGVSYLEMMALNTLDDHWIYPDDVLVIKLTGETANGQEEDAIDIKGLPLTSLVGEITDEVELLARAVYAEARGEPIEGQVAVAAVILNRLSHPSFPKTIKDIIYQPYAFTAVNDGQISLTPDRKAYLAVAKAMDGEDPSEGSLYYWNPEIATSKWIWTRPITKMIGNHVFAK